MYKNITNDVYGNNMTEDEAKKAIGSSQMKPATQGQKKIAKPVETQVSGRSTEEMTIEEYNEYLHLLQRNG